MVTWWNSISVAEKIFFFIAVPSTLILLIQTILALIGIGDGHADGDFSPDHDFDGDSISGGDGMAFFSVRGFLSFLSVMGWSGFVLLFTDIPEWLAIIIAIALGLVTFFAVVGMNRWMQKMQSSGNIVPENAVGKKGLVYLQIPAAGTGSGKVNVVVQERLTEFAAVTTSETPIKTGESITVVSVSDSGVLTVERVKS